MRVSLTRNELLKLIQYYADDLSNAIHDQLLGDHEDSRIIDEKVSRMAALTHQLFDQPHEILTE